LQAVSDATALKPQGRSDGRRESPGNRHLKWRVSRLKAGSRSRNPQIVNTTSDRFEACTFALLAFRGSPFRLSQNLLARRRTQ